MLKIMSKITFFALFFACAAFTAQAATTQAGDKRAFLLWQKTFKTEAKAVGISQKTINATFKNAQFLPDVIVLDRVQPEFISPFLSYLNKRVNPNQIALGRALLQEHDAVLTQVENQYGVPKQIGRAHV